MKPNTGNAGSKGGIQELFNHGVRLEQQKKPNEAMVVYKNILEQTPNFRPAYINLGNLLSKARKFHLALRSFHKALNLKEDFTILFNLGVLFYRMHRFTSALSMWQRALAFQEDFARLHLLMGFASGQLGQSRNAEAYYRNVLKLEPNNAQALLALAFHYYNRHSYQAALAYLDKLQQIEPQHPALRELRNKIQFKWPDSPKDPLAGADTEEIFTKLQEAYGHPADEDPFFQSLATDEDRHQKLAQEIETKLKRLDEAPSSDSQSDLAKSLLHLFHGDKDKALYHLSSARNRLS